MGCYCKVRVIKLLVVNHFLGLDYNLQPFMFVFLQNWMDD